MDVSAQISAPGARQGIEPAVGGVLGIVVLLIVYASLYPWSFRIRELPAGPWGFFLHTWPAAIDRFVLRDAAVNVAGYIPLGVFAYLTLARVFSGVLSTALALLLGFSLSAAIEIVQAFDQTRFSSVFDVACNFAGTAAGALLAHLHNKLFARAAVVLHPSPPLVLLLCWIGYQTFPPLPLLSRTRLANKLAALWSSPSFSAVEAVGGIADWLAVACLLQAVAGARKVRAALPILMLLVPARLLIAGRSVSWSESAGAAAAYVVWTLLPSGYARRGPLIAWLSAGTLVLRGFAPYHFSSHPAAFSWLPFSATLESAPDSGLVVLLRKCFLYGAAVWLFGGTRAPALSLALLLGAIEAIQVYLPGRSAEITDPLLLLLMAAILGRLASVVIQNSDA